MKTSKETPENLDKYFEYVDGQLIWKVRHSNRVKVGDRAGSLGVRRYRVIRLNNQLYFEHRLVWALLKGKIEDGRVIDHIDGNRLNNRIENLQLIEQRQNVQKQSKRRKSASGLRNVQKHKTKWVVRVSNKYIGIYNDIELAELVAHEAREKFHGEFANHGQ